MLRQLAYALPSIPSLPGFDSLIPKTYAPWPVWRDSTTEEVKFMPLPKKQAVKRYHKARRFNRQTGFLGRIALDVLEVLTFDFLNYTSGQLDPSIAAIARAARMSISSAKRGLATLKRFRLIGQK
jgi:hypothetical protein